MYTLNVNKTFLKGFNMSGKFVVIDGMKLWQEWDELDEQACREANAKIKLNDLRPDERRKHQVIDRQIKQ